MADQELTGTGSRPTPQLTPKGIPSAVDHAVAELQVTARTDALGAALRGALAALVTQPSPEDADRLVDALRGLTARLAAFARFVEDTIEEEPEHAQP